MSAVSVDLVYMECGSCGVAFAIPEALQRECKRKEGKQWYCPNGHPRIYATTVEEKLREAEDALARERARLDQARARAETLERSRNVYRGKLRATKQRVGHGVCPCCNRSFENLRRHMDYKHPEYARPTS